VLLATLLTLRRNAWGIFVVSAIHAFAYSIIFLVGLPVFTSLLLRRDRRAVVLAGARLAGLLAGTALNPYFPENLRFYAVQAVAPLTTGRALKVGGELEPLNLSWILVSLPAVVLFAVAAARMFWMSRRVPLAVIFAASMLTEWFVARGMAAKFIALFVAVFCALNGFFAWQQVAAAPTPMKFRGLSEYLLKQPHPSTVFNPQWGYYNLLYYLDSRDQYVIGIDPTFMYLTDSGRYWLWRHISEDETATCDRPDCGVAAPEFKEVYRDALTSLYAVAR